MMVKGNIPGKVLLKKTVHVKAEIVRIFDPEAFSCPVPGKLKKVLKKGGDNWPPKTVQDHATNWPDSAVLIENTSLKYLLHLVVFKKNGKISEPEPLFTAPTYLDFNVENYIADGFGSFIYTLDCSGYLMAAMAAEASFPGADIATNAKTALESSGLIFIAGGVVISPIAAAIYGDRAGGLLMDTAARIKTIEAILLDDELKDSDTIIANRSYEVIWATNNGTSSFNGGGKLASKAKYGYGTAQISGSLDAGGDIARKSSFNSFQTLITTRERIPNLPPISVGNLKKTLKALKKKK